MDTMPRYPRFLLAALAAALVCATASAADLSPSAVLYSANQYNGQKVSVIGVITKLQLKNAGDGSPYESFSLCDANACLQVYALGKEARTEGKEVTLKGHFWMFVQRGYQTFHNELDLDVGIPAHTH